MLTTPPPEILYYPKFYLYIKVFHIVSVICWFAGLFYLPRLFVYHAMTKNTVSKNQFVVMEHKLFWYIMTPSLLCTIIFGEILAHGLHFNGWWIHLKLILVGTLVIYHIYCFKLMEDFAKDCNSKSHKWYRVFNEYPTIILLVCVFLTVVKPF